MTKKTTTDRFWEKVNKTDSCWLWTGASSKGRAKFVFNNATQLASHYAWFLKTGELPTKFVCHTCDNGMCVNYEKHLFEGTRSVNMLDASNKDRTTIHSKETIEMVRELHRLGIANNVIAYHFGITRSYVSRIVNNRKRVLQE